MTYAKAFATKDPAEIDTLVAALEEYVGLMEENAGDAKSMDDDEERQRCWTEIEIAMRMLRLLKGE